MVIKGYSLFQNALGLGPQHQWFYVISRTLVGGRVLYTFAEMQSVYSANPSDWAVQCWSQYYEENQN